MHIGQAKLGQADAEENEAKLMTKPAPEWVRTSDPVIRSPARYRWTTAPACPTLGGGGLERMGRRPPPWVPLLKSYGSSILSTSLG